MQELTIAGQKALLEALKGKEEQYARDMANMLPKAETRTVYTIPANTQGVSFNLGIEAGAVALTINGDGYLLSPDGAKDLGNGLLKLSSLLRGEKEKRKRHGHKK